MRLATAAGRQPLLSCRDHGARVLIACSFLTPRERYRNLCLMPHDAFISYSTHDKAAADATCATLEASGIRCWIAPRDITPGAEWGEAIVDAINHCRVMILIFSANANKSQQIPREVERAV